MVKTLEVSFEIALKRGFFCQALTFAIKLDNLDKIKKVVDSCQDTLIKK